MSSGDRTPSWWYDQPGRGRWLRPLSKLYQWIALRRRQQGIARWSQSPPNPVPVWVIGNIAVGGTGKTPLVLAIIEQAQRMGLRVGVISRGYGGRAPTYPCSVAQHPDPAWVGDEPYLIWKRSGVPVVVDPRRPAALEALMREASPDLVLSDDGLQHYALRRELEVAVIDARRGLGNGHCLPEGPLREPAQRLQSVDWVVFNVTGLDNPASIQIAGLDSATDDADRKAFRLQAECFYRVSDGQRSELTEWQGRDVHAYAGIGNPQRFFTTLDTLGIRVQPHAFPDHHAFRVEDFDDQTGKCIVMTEKDAVKCHGLGLNNAWYLQVRATCNEALQKALDQALHSIRKPLDGQETARHSGLPDLQGQSGI